MGLNNVFESNLFSYFHRLPMQQLYLCTVLAVAIDASGNPYMAGRLGKDLITVVQTDLLANGTDLESVKKAGAFVSAFTSTGTGLWTATVGNVAAGDCFHALAQGRSGTMYAGGRVGSTSPIFSGSSSEDVNVLRPMLAKLSNTDGSMEFLLKPEPVKGGEEEYITTLAVDTSDDSLVYAGGKQEKDRGTVYKFNDKDIVASYRLKDSGPVAAISASSSTSGRFATVGGCYLNRLDSRGTTFIEFPTKIEADGKCIGEPQGIAHRDSLSEDGALMVLVQQSEGLKPELLLFLDKNGWLVGRAPGATSLTGPAHGPLLSGDSLGVVAGVDGSDTFVGGTDLTTQTGLLRKAEITAAETAESLRERNLFVIIAAAGGGAVVFVGGLVIVGIIVAYTKTTGDPA